ncbi:hypothetical protein A500_13946 [Clostridium sartagoforme AAU1]|jgi:Protein of unknown function (DUF3892)|uniref:DUF3892 domain-containing protein n=1 Tax=Clostridium sartagoforme AAU1 TaxID=1202534 RepID=R9C1Y2_9CLOT|nr:DUF3892 domain-containing protein [Clostridium sartagoforme]EOR21236.1 hypothetical protein A500_13946 [Clostridium sartagoforme AAU1]
MKEKNEMIGDLPRNINKNVPTPNNDAQSIRAIIKNSGEIVGYELSNGKRINKEEGVQMAKNGQIAGVAVGVSRKGEEYLRSLPDENENNNLSSLPVIK